MSTVNRALFAVLIIGFVFLGLFLSSRINNRFELNPVAADNATTSVVVAGSAPAFTDGPRENPTSSTSTPTDVGLSVTFNATATDSNGDQYYLIVCSSATATPNNNAAPTCAVGSTTWCVSSVTASGAKSTCSTTTVDSWAETNAWWGFACDYSAASQCSTGSPGTGDPGSPFMVNHRPNFISVSNNGPKDPGATITITANASDTDTASPDTVSLYVCKSNDWTTSSNCGAGGTWCSITGSSTNPACSFAIPDPQAHGNVTYYPYVKDNHNFAATGAGQGVAATFAVNDVAPTVSNVTIHGGEDIDVSLGGEGPTGNVSVTSSADVTDHNGCADIASATSSFFTTEIDAAGCTAQNANQCYYNVACSPGSCQSSITYTYVCTSTFYYHANPTDVGSYWESSTWKAKVFASDGSTMASSTVSTGRDLTSYTALNVSSTINYGSLGISEIADGTALPKTASVYSSGNTGVDLSLSGGNMTGTASTTATIAVGQQKYATSGVAYSAATALSGSATPFTIGVLKTTTTASLSSKLSYWGLQIPLGTFADTYTGYVNFTAVKSASSTW